jgi:hypothetical protein
MAATDCKSCGGKVNVETVVCPHCGTRRPDAVRPTFSKEEVRALLVTNDIASKAGDRGIAATLVFPHPEVYGSLRWVELAMTVLCAPLVLVGIALTMLGKRWLAALNSRLGEIFLAGVMTCAGLSFAKMLSAMGVGHPVFFALVSVGALWTRTAIRLHTIPDHSADLLTVAKPVRRPRAIAAPPPIVNAPAAVESPKIEPATAVDDQPRLLH